MDDSYELGKIVAILQYLGDMPNSMVAKIATNPLQKLPYYLKKIDNPQVTALANQINALPSYLTDIQAGKYWIGYCKQKKEIWDKHQTETMKELVQTYRFKKGLTQPEFAKLCGISPRTIASVELGQQVSETSIDIILRYMADN